MGWAILIGIVILFIFVVAAGIQQADQNAANASSLESSIREEFDIDELYVSQTNQSFLGISFDRDMLVIGDPAFRKEYMFSEVASVDIVKNGTSVTSTNRGSQLLGAAVGGIALGGIGLLAGALTGSKRTMDRTNEIGIKVVVDDRVKPLHYVQMFKWPDQKGLESENGMVKPFIDLADRWNAHIVNGMRKALQSREDQMRVSGPVAVPLLGTSSYADQVKQLWELHQAGALSAEEFQQQKDLLAL